MSETGELEVAKRKKAVTRIKQTFLAAEQHQQVCQFLKNVNVYDTFKAQFGETREFELFEYMLEANNPVPVKDLEGISLSVSSCSATANNLGEYIEKFSHKYEILKDKKVVITIPRRRGGAQIGYYFACVNEVSLNPISPEQTKDILDQAAIKNEERNPLSKNIQSFTNFIGDRTRGFVGRDYVFNAIDEFINMNESGYFLIRGDPGMGKSSIIAKLIEREAIAVYHFNIALQAINSARQFLTNICARIIVLFDLPYTKLPEDIGEDGIFFNELITEAAANLEGTSKLVIAIDALDELKQQSF